jgi:glutamate 5-kinase
MALRVKKQRQARERIVIKFGSGVLAGRKGTSLDRAQFRRLCGDVAALVAAGHQCVIVSSGAVAAGLDALGLDKRPPEVALRQAAAAVGQSRLMHLYQQVFARHGLIVAQLLLTHSDLDSRIRHVNACNTLERLLANPSIISIINENDSVAVEELKFGDNDRLSAEVALIVRANRLIMLTSVEGLLDASGNVVPRVTDFSTAGALVRSENGPLSVGGMVTKLQAAQIASAAGVKVVIASGRKPGVLAAIMSGRKVGTAVETKGTA